MKKIVIQSSIAFFLILFGGVLSGLFEDEPEISVPTAIGMLIIAIVIIVWLLRKNDETVEE